jgi:hypothetical protein
MNLWTIPHLAALSGGAQIFDLRITGYTTTEARDYLDALGPAGRAFYREKQLLLDSVFPVVSGASIALFYRLSTHGWAYWCLFALAVVAAGLDCLENSAIREMLEFGPGETGERSDLAMSLTVSKFAAYGLALTIAGALLLRRGWRKGKDLA